MRRIIIFTMVIVIISIIGCEDKTVNNYYEGLPGGISGYTSPADSGAVTAIGNSSYQGIINNNGFFQILGMHPGIYDVILYPENYSNYIIYDVFVTHENITILDRIQLSTYPFPIRRTSPEDNAENVGTSLRLELHTFIPLNLDDLNAGTEITPPVDGNWDYYRDSYYRFSTTERLQVGTTYYIVLAAGIRTEEGVPIGETVHFSFTTESLEVMVYMPQESEQGGMPVVGFNPRISFNNDIYLDSVNAAVQFIPEIAGLWLHYYDRSDQFFFFPTGRPLSPQTDYMMIISDQVNLYNNVSLPRPDTTFFVTEGYGVNYVYPSNGNTSAHPRSTIRLIFSLPMDTASVEAAFSLWELDPEGSSPIDPPLEGYVNWIGKREMHFNPMEDMNSGSAHRINVTTEAQTETGIPIDEEFESYFLVQ